MAECVRLESGYTSNGIAGSNPALSAKGRRKRLRVLHLRKIRRIALGYKIRDFDREGRISPPPQIHPNPRRIHLSYLDTVLSMLTFVANRIVAKGNALTIKQLDQLGVPPTARFTGTLKLATFNIAHGRGTAWSNWSDDTERSSRLTEVALFLRKKDVDIVVLNEVDFDSIWSDNANQADAIAREAGFRYIVEQRNYDLELPFIRLRFGNALLSRYPIEGAILVEFSPYSYWEKVVFGAKNGMTADIRVSKNLTIRVLAVHLDDRSEDTRIQCAQNMLNYASTSPFPFLLMGDFNSAPSIFSNAEVGISGKSAVDVLLASNLFKTHPGEKPTRDQFTFPSMAPFQVIDWIFAPSGWKISHYEVADIRLSDHRPVVAHLQVW